MSIHSCPGSAVCSIRFQYSRRRRSRARFLQHQCFLSPCIQSASTNPTHPSLNFLKSFSSFFEFSLSLHSLFKKIQKIQNCWIFDFLKVKPIQVWRGAEHDGLAWFFFFFIRGGVKVVSSNPFFLPCLCVSIERKFSFDSTSPLLTVKKA